MYSKKKRNSKAILKDALYKEMKDHEREKIKIFDKTIKKLKHYKNNVKSLALSSKCQKTINDMQDITERTNNIVSFEQHAQAFQRKLQNFEQGLSQQQETAQVARESPKKQNKSILSNLFERFRDKQKGSNEKNITQPAQKENAKLRKGIFRRTKTSSSSAMMSKKMQITHVTSVKNRQQFLQEVGSKIKQSRRGEYQYESSAMQADIDKLKTSLEFFGKGEVHDQAAQLLQNLQKELAYQEVQDTCKSLSLEDTKDLREQIVAEIDVLKGTSEENLEKIEQLELRAQALDDVIALQTPEPGASKPSLS